MTRKFYAAHSNYGKCTVDSLNGTAWDYIKAFDSKKDRDNYVSDNANWFCITVAEYSQRKNTLTKWGNTDRII
jgi:hypothetical protein